LLSSGIYPLFNQPHSLFKNKTAAQIEKSRGKTKSCEKLTHMGGEWVAMAVAATTACGGL